MPDKINSQHNSKVQKTKINFKQDCETMRDTLTQIKDHSPIETACYMDNNFDIALNGFPNQKQKSLTHLVNYYRDSKNYHEWGEFILANYDSKSIAYLMPFLKSMETYYQATYELAARQQIAAGIQSAMADTKPVYQIWQIHIQNSLHKLEQVLSFL